MDSEWTAAKLKLQATIKCRTRDVEGCWLWTGYIPKKPGYAVLHTSLPGQPKRKHRVHRLSYWAFNSKSQKMIPSHDMISHLCHVKHCVSKDHLTVEPLAINKFRSTRCVPQKKCCGHIHNGRRLPDCIFR